MSDQFEVVYPVVHRYQRKEKLESVKSQFIDYTGYIGERYKKVTDKNPMHFTTRSVYTRHLELSVKYKYDFDPQKSKVLNFLKRKWNEQLFQYLSMFSSGYYVKKRSNKDKRQFKNETNFKLKKNPLFKMVDLLDKLNYIFVVKKLFHSFQKLSQKQSIVYSVQNPNFSQYFAEKQTLSQLLQKTEDIQESDQKLETDNESDLQIQPTRKQFLVLNPIKLMKFYHFYTEECLGRSVRNELYRQQQKMFKKIIKAHRKTLKKYSIDKILYGQVQIQYRPKNY